MSYTRQLFLFLICFACAVAVPCSAQLAPTIVLFHSIPEIDGTGLPQQIIHLAPGETVTFTGAQVDQPNGLTLAALETPGEPDVLIESLLIQSQGRLKIKSDHGSAALPPQFSVPWTATDTSSGVLLNWQPGAGKLGQVYNGVPPPDNRYTLILKVDHSENPGVDFSTFDQRLFSVTAVPEPGMPGFVAALFMIGALVCRPRRRGKVAPPPTS